MEMHRPIIDDTNLPLFAQHDMACAVCYDKPAVFCCNTEVFLPCWECQSAGWLLQRPSWWFKIKRWLKERLSTSYPFRT